MSTSTERMRRKRAKARHDAEPVVRYGRAVVAWADKAQTPTAGRLAIIAADLLGQSEGKGELTLAERMGIPLTFGAKAEADELAERIARDNLARALTEIEDPDVLPGSIRAGLHAAKRLVTRAKPRDAEAASRVAIARVQLGIGRWAGIDHDHRNPPPWDCCGMGIWTGPDTPGSAPDPERTND